jgi:mono/diheme cytochrome c family protein
MRLVHASADCEQFMKTNSVTLLFAVFSACAACAPTQCAIAADAAAPVAQSFEQLKAAGASRSNYRKQVVRTRVDEAPQANLAAFQKDIGPILQKMCVDCHGPDTQEGNIRIDNLDPDLLHGSDANWWLEILAVLSKGEMPPADADELADDDRSRIVEWLSAEIQVASAVRRAEQGHSSFRRMTRYEYNYALQDLLGLQLDFAKDLPPEPASEDGFLNSSEMLQMSVTQFEYYRELSRNALMSATVRGEQPAPIYWGVSMEAAGAKQWDRHERDLDKIRKQFADDPEKRDRELKKRTDRLLAKPRGAHFRNLSNGQSLQASWGYNGASYTFKPVDARPEVPVISESVAIIPARQKLIVELGNTVPDEGTLRVRIRASQTEVVEDRTPSLRLEFGWQASNNSAASVRISEQDVAIDAAPGEPKFYQWDIPLSEIYPRNPMRNVTEMGVTPSPSEYVRLFNSSLSQGDIQIDYVEITAPVYDDWPPASHTQLFIDSDHKADETVYAREVLTQFMERAWRRTVTLSEVDQKLALFARVRPVSNDFQEAMVEVLATVLSSPKFLYLVQDEPSAAQSDRLLNNFELATRLSTFLWSSTPDKELLELAKAGRLSDGAVLISQTNRMLADARAGRFSKHFVRQWLGMQLLDFLDVDKKAYPQFDVELKEAMQEEPVAFFHDLLENNRSVMNFIHADYTMVNERLARHYGLSGVYGNHFRKVALKLENRRGGILTQAGLLAMNSDGKDSHPLKRGIWLLESLLNDPPPPPPPAVPEIDLADPEIAKLTLKQRIENHRNDAACLSCHAKIDPWGIAFENFDAVGSWRTQIKGEAVDASSLLFNRQKLDGMDGLKRFLLANRQDQFARAMVHKLTTYALGRPLTFSDRSDIDRLTADFRKKDDRLADLISLIVTSEIFQSK